MSMHLLCPEGHPVILAASKLGSEVACPRCLSVFFADVNPGVAMAKAEKGKPRPAKDDDDDDDEKPPKKAKSTKGKKEEGVRAGDAPVKKKAKPTKPKKDDDDEDEEDEKPRKKSKAKDDDEEEDEDEEQEEEEPPIEWTPRKRQLNICSHGLMLMMIGFYMLCAFAAFTALAVDYFEMIEDWKRDEWRSGPAWYLFYFLAVPMLYLATGAIMACMVMSFFAVPAKAEARAGLIASLVFGGLVFLLGLLIILSMTGVITAEDPTRQKNMMQLLVGGSMACFAVCVMAAMGYQARLFVFMKMHLESSQPITNGAFGLLVFVFMLVVVTLASPMAKENIGDWMGYIVALLFDVLAGFGVYMLVSEAMLIQRLRQRIATYIRDE